MILDIIIGVLTGLLCSGVVSFLNHLHYRKVLIRNIKIQYRTIQMLKKVSEYSNLYDFIKENYVFFAKEYIELCELCSFRISLKKHMNAKDILYGILEKIDGKPTDAVCLKLKKEIDNLDKALSEL